MSKTPQASSHFCKFFHVCVQLPAFHDPDAKRKGEERLVLFEQPTTSNRNEGGRVLVESLEMSCQISDWVDIFYRLCVCPVRQGPLQHVHSNRLDHGQLSNMARSLRSQQMFWYKDSVKKSLMLLG